MAVNRKAKDWLKSRSGYSVMGVIGLWLTYFFFTRSVDTGSLLQYVATLGFGVLSIKLIIRAIKKR